jgi:RNA polymerase sigma-54 factor
MALRLELKQSQTLVMTPQLQQSIKLLQLSNIELNAVIERELAENPLLERAGDDRLSSGELPPDPHQVSAGIDEGAHETYHDGSSSAADASDGSADAGTATVYDPEADMPGGASGSALQTMGLRSRGNGADSEFDPIDAAPERGPSLAEHLQQQLGLATRDPVVRLIGMHLIDAVDEAGYLRADLDQVCERLGVARAVVDQTLHLLQGFEPVGVCARSLSECLMLQLREQNRLDPMMCALLQNLDRVAEHDYAALSRLCRAQYDDIRDMIGEIRQLNPKPGLMFGHAPLLPMVPDVFVRLAGDGWHLELNTETLPRLLVDRTYAAMVRAGTTGKDKSFISDCLNSANWLIKSLDQRAQTILKVAREIVARQDGFLRHGVTHLRPMVLRDVAEEIGMHESTVSRATSHKYMSTPRGTFEFKYFFSSAIASSCGPDAHSSEAVRHIIRRMIDGESADAVLSDDQIVDVLRASGVDIARRTVAKYRDILRIPSSRERRRSKRARALEST